MHRTANFKYEFEISNTPPPFHFTKREYVRGEDWEVKDFAAIDEFYKPQDNAAGRGNAEANSEKERKKLNSCCICNFSAKP